MDQFHKKTNESHYSKSYCCCHGNLLELFSIRFGASFNQPNGVLHKLPTWLNELHHLIHDAYFSPPPPTLETRSTRVRTQTPTGTGSRARLPPAHLSVHWPIGATSARSRSRTPRPLSLTGTHSVANAPGAAWAGRAPRPSAGWAPDPTPPTHRRLRLQRQVTQEYADAHRNRKPARLPPAHPSVSLAHWSDVGAQAQSDA